MDTQLVESLTKLVSNVGFPGAIILYLMWLGKGLLPWAERFVIAFEKISERLDDIKEELSRLRPNPSP